MAPISPKSAYPLAALGAVFDVRSGIFDPCLQLLGRALTPTEFDRLIVGDPVEPGLQLNVMALPRERAQDLQHRVLVERARKGDLNSFEQLVERHRDVVYRVAARIVGPDEAGDVSQDAFL